jgi:cysteine desulfurase/selenocysteine lyase
MTDRRAPLTAPEDIPAIAGRTWLYTGAEGPPLAVQDDAMRRYLGNRALAENGRSEHAVVERRLRGRLANLFGLEEADVALVGNASEAMNLVAGSLGFTAGDNVVLNDLEYPSVVQPWLRLREAGVEVRVARHVDWQLPADSIAALVDDRTRALVVSHVSYHSGWRHDLSALSAAAERVGALFVVDATQSLGVVPVPATLADVVISSSYKWLLGGHGLGVLAWNRERRPLPEPPGVGWRSVPDLFSTDRFERYELHEDARRFEVGFPSFPTIYQLEAALAWLQQFDAAAVRDHVLALSGRLVGELADRGWRLLTSADPDRRAGNVAVATAHGAELAAALAENEVHCWGGDGRLRASVHLFNGDLDVDCFLTTLDHMPDRWTSGRSIEGIIR